MTKPSMLVLAGASAFAGLSLVAIQFVLSLPPLFDMLRTADPSMLRQLVRDLTAGLLAG